MNNVLELLLEISLLFCFEVKLPNGQECTENSKCAFAALQHAIKEEKLVGGWQKEQCQIRIKELKRLYSFWGFAANFKEPYWTEYHQNGNVAYTITSYNPEMKIGWLRQLLHELAE